jgi:hypothetical protein
MLSDRDITIRAVGRGLASGPMQGARGDVAGRQVRLWR